MSRQGRPQRAIAMTTDSGKDPEDPGFKSVELAQRGRMVLDVALADLHYAEANLGPFHETTWHFRNALAEARISWDRLRAEFGTRALEAALAEPPLTFLTLGDPKKPVAVLVVVAGQTYRVQQQAATAIAPSMWKLTSLAEDGEGPYYVARLRDGSARCDCAEWTYNVAEIEGAKPCKHIAGLESLGWL